MTTSNSIEAQFDAVRERVDDALRRLHSNPRNSLVLPVSDIREAMRLERKLMLTKLADDLQAKWAARPS